MLRRFHPLLVLTALVAATFAVPVRADPDPVDYAFIPLPATTAASALPTPKFRFVFGSPARWPGAYRWRYNPANAPVSYSNEAAAVADLQRAMDTWTMSCGVAHAYEGTTSTQPNARFEGQPDYENVVGWGELDSGRSGVTYAWYRPGSGVQDLVDADIILSPAFVRSSAAMDRTGRHEWGHAIGLAHSDQPGALMSGPPDTEYSSTSVLQYDDVRGCRCLYGPPEGRPAGYACSVPSAIDMGAVPVGAPSAPRPLSITNDGNAPLVIVAHSVSSAHLRIEGGCEAGSSIAPGSSCTLVLVAIAPSAGAFAAEAALEMSDGAYRVAVSFQGTGAPPVGGVVAAVEYFHAAFGHYFVTTIAGEISALDGGTIAGWQRTGRTFSVWSQLQAQPPTAPVCRFFSARFAPKSSHFYSASAQECASVRSNADWQFEGDVFHVALPDATGQCAAGTQPVYRLYNEGLSGAPNHRFTTDQTIRAAMVAQGWTPEGAGLGVTMCAAQ